MENQIPQAQTQPQPAPAPQNPQDVGFPQTPKKEKGSFIKWAIALIGAGAIILVGGFLVIRGFSGGSDETSPSPTPSEVLGGFDLEPESTPTPKPTIKKAEIKIEVLNGTGVAGEASLLKTRLENLGYEDVEAANADSQKEVATTVTFDRDVDEDVVDEVSSLLEKTYKSVKVKKSSLSGGIHIRILTGPREGMSTPKPTASPTPSGTPKPTPTPSPSPETSPST